MKNNSQKVTWHEIHPILPRTAGPQSLGHSKLSERAKQNAKPSYGIHTCRLAYIHAQPLMIVGIDTIPGDDGGHREGVRRNRGG